MKFISRLFDQNYDGYIDKKEFKWMTTSAKVSNKTIDIVFSVSSFKSKSFLLLQIFGNSDVTLMAMESWTTRSSKK